MKKEDKLHSDLCFHIKEKMEEENISLGELSARTGIDKSNLSRIVNGGTKPKAPTLAKIADGMDRELRMVPKAKK